MSEKTEYTYPNPVSSATATLIPHFHDEDNRLFVVVIRRAKDPYADKLALPGGFHNPGLETLEEAGARELKEETHMIVSPEDLHLVVVQSKPDRDPRGVVIDHVYHTPIYMRNLFECRADDDAADVELYHIPFDWRSRGMDQLQYDFAFDHGKSLWKFLIQHKENYGVR